jgi:serine/threonine protein kinase
MPLHSGTQIGPYEIVERLGAGGMGEVYRARDAKLQRDVAIKVLPAGTLDADRLARFEREARVLAALNHPNIGAIYGFEQTGDVRGLVLELVEGPTLADRLRSGPIPLGEALRIARHIADALDAAHAKGIVHRDLKPENIKVAANDAVKVLDFGLAKVGDGDDRGDLTGAPTITVAGTRVGVILGTAAYMSPEQARGKPLDKRTDIWSFGCVLYEMLTGRRAFAGETVSDSIAAILSREPEWAPLDDVLPQVRRLLARCLEKDADQRLRDIGHARQELDLVLDDLREDRSVARPVGGSRRFTRPVWWRGAAVAGILAIAVFATIVSMWRPAPPLEQPVQLTFFNDSALQPSVSPDGRMVAFIRGGPFASSAPRGQIYVKLLPTGDPVQLTRDPSNKAHPVFSGWLAHHLHASFPSTARRQDALSVLWTDSALRPPGRPTEPGCTSPRTPEGGTTSGANGTPMDVPSRSRSIRQSRKARRSRPTADT